MTRDDRCRRARASARARIVRLCIVRLHISLDNENRIFFFGKAALDAVALSKCSTHRRHSQRILAHEAAASFEQSARKVAVRGGIYLPPVHEPSRLRRRRYYPSSLHGRVYRSHGQTADHDEPLFRRCRGRASATFSPYAVGSRVPITAMLFPAYKPDVSPFTYRIAGGSGIWRRRSG